MSKKKLEINELVKIEALFQDKKWEIEPDKDLRISLYNKYVDRYSRISKANRELFYELTQRFLRIKENEVYSIFKKAYNTIYDDFLDQFDRIFILPLVNPYIDNSSRAKRIPRPKIKSGEKIKVFIEVNEYRELKFSERIIIADNFDSLEREFKNESDLLVLVDDFIGSGKTANKILGTIFKNTKFNEHNTIILALVAQELGVESIYSENQVVSFYNYSKKKAITDYYIDDEKEANLKKVLLMEQDIRCPERWSLGYEKSEALVSIMNKSPNNTLPIFWYETTMMIAPFQRYVNYK